MSGILFFNFASCEPLTIFIHALSSSKFLAKLLMLTFLNVIKISWNHQYLHWDLCKIDLVFMIRTFMNTTIFAINNYNSFLYYYRPIFPLVTNLISFIGLEKYPSGRRQRVVVNDTNSDRLLVYFLVSRRDLSWVFFSLFYTHLKISS